MNPRLFSNLPRIENWIFNQVEANGFPEITGDAPAYLQTAPVFPETDELVSSEIWDKATSAKPLRAARALLGSGQVTTRLRRTGGPGIQRGAAISPGDGTEKWQVEVALGWGL